MLQAGEPIEVPTMKHIFDMFGKSVTQMLQMSLSQQTAIDELRAQLRSCQTQITNITNTIDEFEERTLIKLQEMRPTIYTRDGLPIDDALELVENKVATVVEKTAGYGDSISRLEDEMKEKVDNEHFESEIKLASDANAAFQETALTIQSLQKELQRQRGEMDNMLERCGQMVKLQIEQYKIKRDLDKPQSVEYVTEDRLKDVVNKLKMAIASGANVDNLDLFDENDLEGTLARLKKANTDLDDEYLRKKEKLGSQLNRVMELLGDGDEAEDTVEWEPEFDVTLDGQEHEYRNMGINVGDVEKVEVGDVFKRRPETTGRRRNLGSVCGSGGNRQKLLEEARRQKSQASKGLGGGEKTGKVDEHKLTAKVSNAIMGKVEEMIADLLSSTGGSGVKLDKNDARALVQQLSVLQNVKTDISKLKSLIQVKMDKAEAEQEFAIRVTKEELFSLLLSIFPQNAALQKALASYSNGRPLPPLRRPEGTRSRGGGEEEHYVVHRRQVQTAAPATLVPARNSRLLALNQRFLKGNDGKYYIRDVGGDIGIATASPVAGPPGSKVNVIADQAFDFQPFLPVSAIKGARYDENDERIQVPMEHRTKTPRGETD